MASFVGTGADGDRASKLAKRRIAEKAAFETQKEKMVASSTVGLKGIDDMFQSNQSFQAEERFKASTVGLSSIEDFRKKRLMVEEMREDEEKKKAKARKKMKKMAKKERKLKLNALTFDVDDGEEEEEEDDFRKYKKKKLAKNPDAETFFLKDRERDREDDELRRKLEEDWDAEQATVKEEQIEVTYSYWDGSGHRRTIKLNKGCTIEHFLEKVRRDISGSFHELRGVSSSDLMYIKEDLIIPHHYSFYDLIISKARGKSGPLFHFDVHDDIRMRADARVEKDESHAGKIITRSYYDRNQHIFPVNRWEVYDPSKTYDNYTIKDSPDIK